MEQDNYPVIENQLERDKSNTDEVFSSLIL
jgi:hypothetical protein